MLRFIAQNRMLERYCESLIRDKQTRTLLKDIPSPTTTPHEITISLDALTRLSSSSSKNAEILRAHAKHFLQKDGVLIFTYRERHLLELLGYALWRDQTAAPVQAIGASVTAPEAMIDTK
jgi:hypothetical protein